MHRQHCAELDRQRQCRLHPGWRRHLRQLGRRGDGEQCVGPLCSERGGHRQRLVDRPAQAGDVDRRVCPARRDLLAAHRGEHGAPAAAAVRGSGRIGALGGPRELVHRTDGPAVDDRGDPCGEVGGATSAMAAAQSSGVAWARPAWYVPSSQSRNDGPIGPPRTSTSTRCSCALISPGMTTSPRPITSAPSGGEPPPTSPIAPSARTSTHPGSSTRCSSSTVSTTSPTTTRHGRRRLPHQPRLDPPAGGVVAEHRDHAERAHQRGVIAERVAPAGALDQQRADPDHIGTGGAEQAQRGDDAAAGGDHVIHQHDALAGDGGGSAPGRAGAAARRRW